MARTPCCRLMFVAFCLSVIAASEPDVPNADVFRPSASSNSAHVGDVIDSSSTQRIAGGAVDSSARNDLQLRQLRSERAVARRHATELREQAQRLYIAGEQYRTGSDGASQDGARAVQMYNEAAALNAGAGSAAALAALARLHQIGWDGVSDIIEIPIPEPSHQGQISGRLRRLLNLSGKSYVALVDATVDVNGTANGRPLLVRRSISEAVRLWTAAAELGNATAQFYMGVLHAHGMFGVPLDGAKALSYYTFAAMGGSHDAHMALGHRYHTGLGVVKNCAKSVGHWLGPADAAAAAAEVSRGLAVSAALVHRERLSDEVLEGLASDLHKGDTGMIAYYHNAAEKGEVQAHVALGHLYLLGAKGVTRDYAAAAEHFHAAAEHNDTLSMANLGFMYMHGLGVEQDYATAAAFAQAAADAGMAAALNTLGVLTVRGLVPLPALQAGQAPPPPGPDGTPAHMLVGYSMLKKAAETGFPDGAFNAGLLHANGQAPGGRDFKTALQYFRLAANAGHRQAMVRLAHMQTLGIGGAKDCASAQTNLHGALSGAPSTTSPLANAYRLLGAGNPAGALMEYLVAAEYGVETGSWNAAYLLSEGLVPEASGRHADDGLDASKAGSTDGSGSGSRYELIQVENATLPASQVDATELYDRSLLQRSAGVEAAGSEETAVHTQTTATAASVGVEGQSTATAQSSTASSTRPSSASAVPGPTPAQPSASGGSSGGQPDTPSSSLYGGLVPMAPTVKETLALWRDIVLGQSGKASQQLDPVVERQALRLYQRSAASGNGGAELVIGDYHFYGRAGLNRSAESACEYYRLACGHHLAQACFNLGWAHETGEGVPVDAHLAKRYYDSTVEEQKMTRAGPTAYVPVKLALWRLQAKDGLTWWRDTVVRPLLSTFGVGEWADAANKLLHLYPPRAPLTVPKQTANGKAKGKANKAAGQGKDSGRTASGSVSVDTNGHGNGKADEARGPAGPSPGPSTATAAAPATSNPKPAEPTAPLDPKERVKAALEKSKASRAARQQASSLVRGMAELGGHAADTMLDGLEGAVFRVVNTFAGGAHALVSATASAMGLPTDELTPSDSLMMLATSLALAAVTVRLCRGRRPGELR